MTLKDKMTFFGLCFYSTVLLFHTVSDEGAKLEASIDHAWDSLGL